MRTIVEDIDLNPDDIAVSVHACGQLTDTIIETTVNGADVSGGLRDSADQAG